MLTLDETGLLLEWPYRKEHHSTYGWFFPAKSTALGLNVRMMVRTGRMRRSPAFNPRPHSRPRSHPRSRP